MKKIISVVGARPNFIKIAPIHRSFQTYKSDINHLICHTGQHFDEKMSKIFFDELQMPKPDFYLGSVTYAINNDVRGIKEQMVYTDLSDNSVVIFKESESGIIIANYAGKWLGET